MRVIPTIQDGSVTWAEQRPSMISVGVWTEKKRGRGEDAEPLVLHENTTQRGVLAVCDGVGGAGVQVAGRTADGTERSGAWVSARAVRIAVEQHFVRLVRYAADRAALSPQPEAPEALQQSANPSRPSLHRSVGDILQELRNPARSRIGGTMQRELPSTLAAIFYRQKPDFVQLHVRWAGDSRCYLLDAVAGLQQLSQDDTDTPDALSSLEQDPPMTNQIAADGRYRIHDQIAGADTPCILLCATDGFFNYVQTPAHFEYLLLATLSTAANADAWAAALGHSVQAYTQDDASLALVALGYPGFDDLRVSLEQRLSVLTNEHWLPFQDLDPADHAAFRQVRLESWQKYRTDYEDRILAPAEGRL